MLNAVAGDATRSEEYAEDGVDVSLIRWMLSLTPLERLQFLDQHTNDILAIRELNAEEPPDDPPAIVRG